VKKTVRDVSDGQYPMLTRTNYTEWVVLMKVMLKARRLWAAMTVGTTDEEDDQSAMEAILKSVPTEYVVPLGAKDSAKEAWESLETMRLGGDRVRKAKAQQLRREYEAIAFRDGEAIEDFALRLTSLVSQLAQVGVDIGEEEAVAKYLRVVPPRFAQIALSIETLLDMSTLSIEEVTGRLKAVEDRAEAPARTTAGGQLLLTEEQWAARLRERKQGEGSSVSRSGGGGGAASHGGRRRAPARTAEIVPPTRIVAAIAARSGTGPATARSHGARSGRTSPRMTRKRLRCSWCRSAPSTPRQRTAAGASSSTSRARGSTSGEQRRRQRRCGTSTPVRATT